MLSSCMDIKSPSRYELWKPYLRAMMESDMKLVSDGAKSKQTVLDNCLKEMKACFLDARLKKVNLMEAMAVFFDRSNRSTGDEPHTRGEIVRRCGVCQESDMVLKQKQVTVYLTFVFSFPPCGCSFIPLKAHT
ncbi:hypothetical protein RJ641_009907 [Dillenia turbinata]|uniref:DNA topoisomerase n=1 Tax=Dillenia turbinata TaxID=194707 RepID=A0AAN8V6M0_9MAGN